MTDNFDPGRAPHILKLLTGSLLWHVHTAASGNNFSFRNVLLVLSMRSPAFIRIFTKVHQELLNMLGGFFVLFLFFQKHKMNQVFVMSLNSLG